MPLIPLRQKIIDHIMEYATQWANINSHEIDELMSNAQLVVLRENIFRIKDHRDGIFPRHTIRARMHELRNDPNTPTTVSSILNAMVEKAGRPYP